MLKKFNKLKKKKEFSYVYHRGKSYYSKYLSLYVSSTKLKNVKIGFSISNKVGNSVVRHKLKRRLSEILLKEISNLPLNNYVFVAKIGCETLDFDKLKIQVQNLLEKVKNER
ncbi:MAG: ribonuclease P protein component [Clostridia bacterium]|nr:ribonuclease P protein component [Clostridia bacterium]